MGKHPRIDSNTQLRLQSKRSIKFIAVCPFHNIITLIIRKSHITVVKSICNAALNAAEGDIGLSSSEKSIFHQHQPTFRFLTDRSVSLSRKREFLLRNRNHILSSGLLSLLLSTVLKSIGTSFIVPIAPINDTTIIQKVHTCKS